jgi:hypothetical protein
MWKYGEIWRKYGEIWRKNGRNMREMWKYEGMCKYEGNVGAILVDNMYTNQ